MNTSIIVTLITVSGSILVAALTFYLTKIHQIKTEWQNQKLNHYKVLLASLSDLAIDNQNREAKAKLALASNTIALVASQAAISALMAYHEYLIPSGKDKNPEKHDTLLKTLLLEIRKDIGLSEKDHIESFVFRLVK